MAFEHVFVAFSEAVEETADDPAWTGPDAGEGPPVRPELAFARGVCAALEVCISPRAREIIRRTAQKVRERRGPDVEGP